MISYSAEVWRYFALPARPPGQMLRGEAGSREQRTWIRFGMDLAAGQLKNVGFRAFACPHIIAACQKAAELLEGAPVGQLSSPALGSLQESLQQAFDIPVEKAGKLLILKDALSVCSAAAGQTEETE